MGHTNKNQIVNIGKIRKRKNSEKTQILTIKILNLNIKKPFMYGIINI